MEVRNGEGPLVTGKDPLLVCLTKASRNAIYCGGWLMSVHKKCGIKGPL